MVDLVLKGTRHEPFPLKLLRTAVEVLVSDPDSHGPLDVNKNAWKAQAALLAVLPPFGMDDLGIDQSQLAVGILGDMNHAESDGQANLRCS